MQYMFANNKMNVQDLPEIKKSYDPSHIESLIEDSKLKRVIDNSDPEDYTSMESILDGKNKVWNIDNSDDYLENVVVISEIYLTAIMIFRWLTYDTCTLGDIDFRHCISITWDIFDNHPNKPKSIKNWFNRCMAAYEKGDMSQYLVETEWIRKTKYDTFVSTDKFVDVLGYQPD